MKNNEENRNELIEKYLATDLKEVIDVSSPSRYFKTAKAFYEGFQEGQASPETFFGRTMVVFEECDAPKRKPDFTSDSGSMYWYVRNGVVRGSNHWGNTVAECDWALKMKNGRTVYGQSAWSLKTFGSVKYGFAKWSDFVYKTRVLDIADKKVLTSFANTLGRDFVIADAQKYQRRIVEIFEPVE